MVLVWRCVCGCAWGVSCQVGDSVLACLGIMLLYCCIVAVRSVLHSACLSSQCCCGFACCCRIRHRSRGETLLLQLDVAASSSGIVATLSGRQGGFAPYRIDNCSAETLHVQQAGCAEQEDVLKPYSSLPYAWDEPSLPHKVRHDTSACHVSSTVSTYGTHQQLPVYSSTLVCAHMQIREQVPLYL